MEPWWARRRTQVGAAVALAGAAIVALAWASLLLDWPPAGGICDVAGGVSSASRLGRESIDWHLGILPERVCTVAGDVERRRSAFLWTTLTVVLALSTYAGLRLLTAMARRLAPRIT